MAQKLVIRRPDDFHVHLREGSLLAPMVRLTSEQFARAIVMPNLKKPVATAGDAADYKWRIHRAGLADFVPLMTIKLLPSTTPHMIYEARQVSQDWVNAVKLYPEGVTTNSADGIDLNRDWQSLDPVFRAMEEVDMPLLLHGEMPGVFCLDRELRFLPILDQLVRQYPRLKIVLEHITTKDAVQAVRNLPETVAATITVHHLILTLDHVIGDKMHPHNFCKPVAKTPADKDALVEAAISGNPKFFLGTDSAPHLIGAKECAEGCAGVFTAPVAMPLLATVFEMNHALDRLEDFTARFGAEFYGLPLNEGTLMLTKELWYVPQEYWGVRPFFAGLPLGWRVVS